MTCDIIFRIQNMGNCSCSSTKNITQQQHHQINNQNSTIDQKQTPNNVSNKQLAQKKRAKKALIIHNENIQIQDNAQYNEQSIISATDVSQIKKALKKHFIFSQLSQEQIHCFIKQMKPCSAHRNNYIFKQGDKSGSYYIILQGVCQIEINNEKKRTITYGDSFGDLGIIYSAPRSASVLALTDCELVQINRKIFKKVMEDINQLYQKENKKFLQVLTFFKDLTEQQKNAIASTCLTQTYKQGQVIFNQGDDANSFYVIKQGVVNIKQKNHELKQMDCFGENSIVTEGGTRTNTLVAKTSCKIISMSRQNIKTSLGDSLKNVIKRNMMWKIINQSKLHDQLDSQKLKEAADSCEFISIKKGEVVFKKDSQHKNCIYILLNTQLTSPTIKYQANSIIQVNQILDQKTIKINDDMTAVDEGFLAKLTYTIESSSNIPGHMLKSGKEDLASNAANQDKSALQKKMTLNDFQVVRKLRQGNFGKVYACWNNKTQKLYAIKVLDRAHVQRSQIIQYIMNEEQILRTVPKFPFIVGFNKLIKDTNFIYFIMELIKGEDLFDVITKVVSFTVEHTRFLVSQILLMMEHMHSNRIIYRDLKPENLMMNTDGYLVLVDMGTAKRLKIQRRFRTNTIIGTPHYMAPEIITSKGYSFPVDIWSLGVITYQLLCGKLPFGQNSQDPFTIYEQIVNNSAKYPRNCPKSSKAFIQKLLNRNFQHRIGSGYEQLKKHPFFQKFDWDSIMNKSAEPFYKPSDDTKITKTQIQKALTDQKNNAITRFLRDRVQK